MNKNRKRILGAAVMCSLILGCSATAFSAFAEENDSVEISVSAQEETEKEATSEQQDETEAEITEVDDKGILDSEIAKKYPESANIVYRFYTEALRREPDEVGFENWVKRLSEQGVTGARIAYNFFNNREYLDKFGNISDDDYIDTVYKAVFGRMPSEAEFELMTRFLSYGVSRNYILRALVMNQEYIDICSKANVKAETFALADVRDEDFCVTWFISDVYKTILGRKYDETGLKNWVTRVRNQGYTASDVIYTFINSAEFKKKNLSDEEYIRTVYRLVIGREPSQETVNDSADLIAQGYSRRYLLRSWIVSDEFSSLCASRHVQRGDIALPLRDSYPAMSRFIVTSYSALGRIPSDNEVGGKINQLRSGVTGPQLIKNILNSPEYISKNTTNEQFVTDLVSAACGREATEWERTTFSERLANGTSRYDIISEVTQLDEFVGRCDNAGIGNGRYAYPLAVNALNYVGWDLSSAFRYAAGISYYGHTWDMPQTAATSMEWYANYGFSYLRGNCYVMAAMFCEMAKTLGYDAHQIGGYVPMAAGGWGDHSWVEINMNGGTYVFDPDFAHETGRNGYMIYYGQSGTWRYSKGTYMS